MMVYLISLVCWVVVGNIWFDLLMDVAMEFDDAPPPIIGKILNIVLWPYSIYGFMKELKKGIQEKTIGDITSSVDNITATIVSQLNTNEETYMHTMANNCTPEEVDDIVSVVLRDMGTESDELNRVRSLYNMKSKHDTEVNDGE